MIAVEIILIAAILIFAFVVVFGAPFVPTRARWAATALDLAKIGPIDTVVDLGSGNGIVLHLAAQRGARVVGYELNPLLVLWSRLRLLKYGKRARVQLANFWMVDLPNDTTVVYVFAVERDERKLIRYLEDQASKVRAKKLKVISFGLPLSGKKSLGQAQGANLYKF
jgi:16S rRNA A1518/A1519 N6-dimethyltransferase RsmA/KsgA/DIM1 with predicted DNA glycosylase/AP lyase activity